MAEHFGTTFRGSTNTDHIRRFIAKNKRCSYYDIADNIGCSPITLMNYVNGYHNTGIHVVEAMLNEMGYSLGIVWLGADAKEEYKTNTSKNQVGLKR